MARDYLADPEASVSRPAGGKKLAVVLSGGPPAVDVELSVGGKWAATIGKNVPSKVEIQDLLVAGENDLQLKLVEPEEPRAGKPLEIRVVEIETQPNGSWR